MVALYTARICEFFVKRLCSGLWSGSFSVFPPPSHPYFSSFHCFISVTGAWNGGSWLGCGDLPAMGAVFYLGAGWPRWKPLGIPGTHLPLKRGSLLNPAERFHFAFRHVYLHSLPPPTPNNAINGGAPSFGPRLSLFSKVSY